MKTFRSVLFPVIAALIFVPSLAEATALSDLTAPTAMNTITSTGNFQQTWNWPNLTAGPGLYLSSAGTSATSGQLLFEVISTGANSTSGLTTYGALIAAGHSGTSSTNYGLQGIAVGGTQNNYAINGLIGPSGGSGTPNSGDAAVWGNATGTTAATYAIYGTNASSTGYAGYFNETGGGYAAAFLGGNVGIGTATPQSLVHAYGGEVQVGSSGASCAAARGGAIRFSGSTLYYCDGASTWQTVGGGGGSGTVTSSTAGQVAYYQSTGATVIGTSTMNIVSGNVGIGTATPQNLLDVNGATSIGYNVVAPSNGLIVSGNVGIGTTSPFTPGGSAAEIVQLESQDYSQYMSSVTNGAATNKVWRTIARSSTSGLGPVYQIQTLDDTGGSEVTGFQLTRSGNSITKVLFPNGSVGIGNASPSYTLQVNGSVAGTSAYVNTSDVRYKKNVQPLDLGLDIVMRLKPVSFQWKDEVLHPKEALTSGLYSGKSGTGLEKYHPRSLDAAMQGQQMGFVAQDVEKILPSVVVTEANTEKTKGMKYSELIPVLVKAIQEQQVQLTKDEATIAAMKVKLGM